jgi:hypothetical protein
MRTNRSLTDLKETIDWMARFVLGNEIILRSVTVIAVRTGSCEIFDGRQAAVFRGIRADFALRLALPLASAAVSRDVVVVGGGKPSRFRNHFMEAQS